jgi:uncharacterized protein
MSGGWSRPRDFRQLAGSREQFEFDIPVAELPGISAELDTATPVHARLEFGREQGVDMVRVALHGKLELVCQRCMQPMEFELDTDSHVALLASETELASTPGEWETFLAEEGMLRIPALVAEEVLLALPIVPLHDTGKCRAKDAAARAMERPFADLRMLIERGGK